MQKLFFSFLAALFGFYLSVDAGGFQVNLQGTPNVGMGHVGAALAIDPSAQFFNPGALGMVRSGFTAGTTPIFARLAYREPAPGTYTATNEATVSTPFAAYGSYRLDLGGEKKLAFGLSAYTPFGSRVLYADDWKGQFAIREIALSAIFIQPTLAINFDERFGIGFGPVFATGNVLVRRAIPAQFADGSYGEARLSGAGNGFGFNAGLYYQDYGERVAFGLSYRSKVVFSADNGNAEFTVPDALAEFFPTTTFASRLQLPWTVTAAASYRFAGENRISLDINYVGWSVYQSLDFDFADNTSRLEDSQSPRNYSNAFIFRLGWQKAITDDFDVRAGAYFDMTPVPDGYTTPETPDANKLGLSAGASYEIKRFRIDLAISWVEAMQRTDINLEQNFGGTYKARAIIPGIGLGYFLEGKYNRKPVPSGIRKKKSKANYLDEI